MRRLFTLVTLFGLFLSAGCAEPTETADSAPATSDGSAAADAATATADAAGAGGDTMQASSEAMGGTADSGADTSSADKGTPAGDVDPLAAGLEFPNVNINELLQTTKSEYEANPKNSENVTKYVGLCFQLGMIHAQQENKKTSQDAFLRAGSIMKKGIEDGLELDSEMKAAIFFQLATVEASAGQTEEAMASIEQAIENGFSQLAELKENDDLASVRALPAFSEKLASWEIKAREAMLTEVKAELAHNTPFPFDFQLTNAASGEAIALADFKGKVCIVDIWGTWCPPCREEIPSFIKLQEKFGDAGFQMIGLNQESGKDEEAKVKKVTDYIESAGINYPCALLSEEILDQVPDFGGFPTTLFIDRTGTVRLKVVGLHEYEFLEAIVETLLAESDTP